MSGTINLNCGMPLTAGTTALGALGTPVILTAVAATVDPSNLGSNGTPGPCTLTVTDQTALAGHPSQFLGTVSSGGSLSLAPPILLTAGSVTGITGTVTAGTYNEAVSGCGLRGTPKLNIVYGVVLEQLVPSTGVYTPATPPSGTLSSLSDWAKGTFAMTNGTGSYGSGLKVGVNVYTSTVSIGTDNGPALQKAIAAMNTDAAMGQPRCLYFPAGNYLTSPLSTLTSTGFTGSAALGHGCFLGDERFHSNIFVIPETNGTLVQTEDVFAWLDAGLNGSASYFANTQTVNDAAHPDRSGSSFRNLTIIGDRQSQLAQNALTFYGTTEGATIDNVGVNYMTGHALGAGYAGTAALGSFSRSRIGNVHFDYSGNGATTPALDITATGGAVSQGIDLTNVRVYDALGPGVWLHPGDATSSIRDVRVLDLKIEGSAVSEVSTLVSPVGDLLEIGAPGAGAGANVSDVLCENVDLTNAVWGFAALHVAGANGSVARVNCSGSIQNVAADAWARGLQVDTCTQCGFHFAANQGATTQNGPVPDFQLQVGTASTPGICGNAVLGTPGVGYEGEVFGTPNTATPTLFGLPLAACLDPASTGLVSLAGKRLLGGDALPALRPDGPLSQTVGTLVANSGTKLSWGTGGFVLDVTAPVWSLMRGGSPGASFQDTFDTAFIFRNRVNALAGGASWVSPGQLYRLRICNQTSGSETLAAPTSSSGTGTVLVAGSPIVAAGSCGNFAVSVLGTSSGGTLAISGP